jgi:hypothetical protein
MLSRLWYPSSSLTHPQKNGQVKRANRLIMQGMKTRIFHDLETRSRNLHKELTSVLCDLRTNINRATRGTHFNLVYGANAVLPPEIYLKLTRVTHFNEENLPEARELDSNLLEEKPSGPISIVLCALRTNINRATSGTPFNLVYGANAVLSPKIYLKSAMVTHFNEENLAEVRELNSNLLEEKRNTTLANVQKNEESLKCYYNKSMVPRELDIGNLVPKKDIHTKDKYKFSSPWEGPFIIVDIEAPGAYVLEEVDGGMLPNT